MKPNTAEVLAVAKAERNAAFLKREAAYATPGTPENKAYHAKLDEITRMANEIRNAKRGS